MNALEISLAWFKCSVNVAFFPCKQYEKGTLEHTGVVFIL